LEQAAQLHAFMARRGILLRLFAHLGSLRLGLPATDADWQRLVQALDDYRKEQP
ncbi:threonine-phosphate decarboxylase, partial [Pseudomonas sp. MAFF212428]|nr:threonine-phosphate decarboxylase [Pseudomonas brassicae]